MKTLSIVLAIFLFCGAAVAQAVKDGDAKLGLVPGTVYGEIVIKEKSGTGMAGYACSNLSVSLGAVGGAWQRRVSASGNFSTLRCSFKVTNVPAGKPFVAVLRAGFPKGCDQETFDTTTSFQMKLKGGEKLRYDFSVSKIGCISVK